MPPHRQPGLGGVVREDGCKLAGGRGQGMTDVPRNSLDRLKAAVQRAAAKRQREERAGDREGATWARAVEMSLKAQYDRARGRLWPWP